MDRSGVDTSDKSVLTVPDQVVLLTTSVFIYHHVRKNKDRFGINRNTRAFVTLADRKKGIVFPILLLYTYIPKARKREEESSTGHILCFLLR